MACPKTGKKKKTAVDAAKKAGLTPEITGMGLFRRVE